jgi:hypothetical protein
VRLAGRRGNPDPRFLPGSGDLVGVDHDTVIRIGDRSVGYRGFVAGATVEGPDWDVSRVRVGGRRTRRRHGVPPGALGDVVALNVVDMAVTRTGGQRIEAVRLSGGVARDWKSGRLLLASN